MRGKINFGCDFLHLMEGLIIAGEENDTSTSNHERNERNSQATLTLFLSLWGFSIAEVKESLALLFERSQSTSLDGLEIVIQRIVDHISNDNEAKKRLIVQMAAIRWLGSRVTENEDLYVHYIQRELDFRPSEFTKLINQGDNLAIALNYFGYEFIKAKRKSP